jgi:hypothetical protein
MQAMLLLVIDREIDESISESTGLLDVQVKYECMNASVNTSICEQLLL